MSEATKTTDHGQIRKWAEKREGSPAKIKTEDKKGGILRIDFGEPEPEFEHIQWDEFFQIFEDNKLAFLHQDRTGEGQLSRFNKFIGRQ
jgi:hypothetical protein